MPSGVKSRPQTRSNTCWPLTFAPVIQRVPVDHPRVDQVADGAGRVRAQRLRPDVALDQHRVRVEVGVVERLDLGRLQLGGQPLEVDLAVPGHPDDQRRPGAVRLGDHEHDVLQGVGGGPGPVGRGNRSLAIATSVAMVGVSGVSSTCAGGASSYGERIRDRASGPPRRWPRNRPASGRRCPRRSRRRPGTPRWPSRPSPPTWRARSRTPSRAG